MRVFYTVLRVMRSSSVALSGLVSGRLHYGVGLVEGFPTGNSGLDKLLRAKVTTFLLLAHRDLLLPAEWKV